MFVRNREIDLKKKFVDFRLVWKHKERICHETFGKFFVEFVKIKAMTMSSADHLCVFTPREN